MDPLIAKAEWKRCREDPQTDRSRKQPYGQKEVWRGDAFWAAVNEGRDQGVYGYLCSHTRLGRALPIRLKLSVQEMLMGECWRQLMVRG